MLHTGRVAECTEWSAAGRNEVPDPLGDQDLNQEVVKRPPRLMPHRPRNANQAHRLIDYHSRKRERVPALVTRDHDDKFGHSESFPPAFYVGVTHQTFSAVDLHYLVEHTRTIDYDLAADPGGHCSSEVRSQRLTASPTQILGVVLRKEEHASAQPMPGEYAQRTSIEERVQGLPGQ
jgi:hypothetical protein